MAKVTKSGPAKTTPKYKSKSKSRKSKRIAHSVIPFSEELFSLRSEQEQIEHVDEHLHIYGNNHICETDSRGFATPGNRSIDEIRVGANYGYIALWAKGTTLRYRFNEASFAVFADPEGVKEYVRAVLAAGVVSWQDSVPVTFTERRDAVDFEIVLRSFNDCDSQNRCVLASAFFPGSSKERLVLYPKMFRQPPHEIVETMVHELGHVFGLRHFFANISETQLPSQLFGTDSRFSIMNYGADSYLTQADIDDLKALYEQIWDGRITEINGTPIRLVRPYSYYAMGGIGTATVSSQLAASAIFEGASISG